MPKPRASKGLPSVKKIAVVEDDISIAMMYQLKLELEGYNVKVAHDGVEGLELCKEFEPDLVLLDIRMPTMDGDEMLERMRSTEWGSKPRIIILTNISRVEAPTRLRFLNVDRLYRQGSPHTAAGSGCRTRNY